MSTYQNKLNSMNTTKGIIYEMNNVAYIAEFKFKFFKNKNVKIVKFEIQFIIQRKLFLKFTNI